MNAVIYARVSSREQREEGFSIEFQLKYLRDYAERTGAYVVKEFIDIETAKNPGRKQFSEMVEFLRRSKGEKIIFVEKTDRLYRNFRDAVTIEDLGAVVHLVKENQIISKDSKSQAKLIHGINVVLSKNYVENLREEVIKGMHTKAESGIYPSRAPFGYKNDKGERTIVVDPEKSGIVHRIFEWYSSGRISLTELRKRVRSEYGITMNRANLHMILKNTFYIGYFVWGGHSYKGTHDPIISSALFESVQATLKGHNRPKYGKQELPFRGLLTCSHDGCAITGERKKGKYNYYRCTQFHGACDLPRFTEKQISEKLAEVFANIRIPDDVLKQILNALQSNQDRVQAARIEKRTRYEQRLSVLRKRMGKAYTDKLDGKIDEEFWSQQMREWQSEERQIAADLESLKQSPADQVLTAQRCLELANKAYLLYVSRNSEEQAELLKSVLLNCSIDGLSVYPTYRKPFDRIFERAKRNEWSGRADLNCRPLAPQASALPG
jgi:site-specific DNA recombinase